MVESKSVGTFSPLQKLQDSQRGLFVDRGVGSPRLVKSASASAFTSDLGLDSEAKVCSVQNNLATYSLLGKKILDKDVHIFFLDVNFSCGPSFFFFFLKS